MTGATIRGVSRSLKEPRYDLVSPVRAVDTITASFIIVLLLPKPCAGAYGRALPTYSCRCHPQPERWEGYISVGSSGGHDRARELPPDPVACNIIWLTMPPRRLLLAVFGAPPHMLGDIVSIWPIISEATRSTSAFTSSWRDGFISHP